MNDLAKIIEHMTAAAERQAGLTAAECMQRDLEQQAAFAEWHADLADWESAEMDGLRVGGVAGCAHSQSGDLTCWCSACYRTRQETAGSIPAADHPSLHSPDDEFSFDPECRELAAHFMPGAPGLSVDYFAQYLHECAQEYLAVTEEFGK